MELKPRTIDELQPKTIDYLNSTANNVETLLALAVEYRHLVDNAKTNVARELYGKKLKKIVKKLDSHLGMFKALEEIKNQQEKSSESEAASE